MFTVGTAEIYDQPELLRLLLHNSPGSGSLRAGYLRSPLPFRCVLAQRQRNAGQDCQDRGHHHHLRERETEGG